MAQFDDAMKVPGAQINYVNRKPIGVAGLITPWNTPFMLESWKLAPALATGNTVVLKPAEFTPLSASLWARIFKEAGLPDGVFNLVNGLGEEAGDALVKHPDVPLISFTGETTTGKTIFRNAAENLKGLSMELGGKSPAIVFADADLDAAIDSTLFGVFSLNGERCTAGSRILVHRDIYEEFVREVRRPGQEHRGRRPARPEDRGRRAGPPGALRQGGLATSRSASPRAGCWPAAGGPRGFRPAITSPRPSSPTSPRTRGSSRRRSSARSSRSPRSTTTTRRCALANNTRYGLAGYVWTNDLTRAHNFAQNVEAGMVWLNSHNVRDLRTPFGGVKASGLGHEGGYRSIDFYTDQQAVHITLGSRAHPEVRRLGRRSSARQASSAPSLPRLPYHLWSFSGAQGAQMLGHPGSSGSAGSRRSVPPWSTTAAAAPSRNSAAAAHTGTRNAAE